MGKSRVPCYSGSGLRTGLPTRLPVERDRWCLLPSVQARVCDFGITRDVPILNISKSARIGTVLGRHSHTVKHVMRLEAAKRPQSIAMLAKKNLLSGMGE